MSKLHDTLTAQEKSDLSDFLASYDAERNFLRENPYTPVFGQYTPSLIFTDAEDTAGQPDGYYFRAQGQEPPQEVEKQLYPIWGYLFAFIVVGGGADAVVGLCELFLADVCKLLPEHGV
jgi:hypothetical protein